MNAGSILKSRVAHIFALGSLLLTGLVVPSTAQADEVEVNVTGIIQDSAGAPLANAAIQIAVLDGSGGISNFLPSATASAAGEVALTINFTETPLVRLTFSAAGGGFESGSPTPFDLSGPVSDVIWKLLAPTLSGTVFKTDGTTPLEGAYVRLEKVDADGNWLASLGQIGADSLGRFAFGVDFTANPIIRMTFGPGYSSGTGSDPTGAETSVIFTGPGPHLGGSYPLALVTLSGTVKDSDDAALPRASVMLEKLDGDQVTGWLGSISAGDDGVFRLAVDFTVNPRVRLTVGPPYGGSALGASKSYILTDGSLNGSYSLAPVNVSGKICDAGITCDSDAVGLARASVQVEQVDADGNWLSFVTSTQADTNGEVKLNLDFAGSKRYKVTVGPPWGGTANGARTAYIVSEPSLSQYWSLTAPNLSGVVRDTNGSPLRNANISVLRLDANGNTQGYLSGGQSNDSGQFTLAVSPDLLAAGSTGIALQINPPMGYAGFGTSTIRKFIPTSSSAVVVTGLDLTIDSANAIVKVVNSSNVGLANSYVNARGFSEMSGTGAQTNSSGLAFLALPNVSSPEEIIGSEYQITAQAPGGGGGDYAGTSVYGYFRAVEGVALPVYVIQLASPNLRIKATADGTADGSPLSWSGIEIRGISDPSAFSWSNTNANGNGNLNLEDGTYELVLKAPWNTSGPVVGDRTYGVTVIDGVATLTYLGNSVETVSGRYLLQPSTPTMTVAVTAGGSASGGGWIEVVNTVTQKWVPGYSVRSDGKAGLVLSDGTYKIMAQPAWGSGTYSSSEPCSVTIASSSISSTTCGIPEAGVYELALRSPNLSFTIKGPTGSAGIPFAYVCVAEGAGRNKTWTCSSANSSGLVSAYVDPPTGSDPTEVEYQISPQGGTSAYVRTTGIADWNAGTSQWDADTDRLSAPNVSVSVTAGGSPVRDGWVNVIRVTGDSWEYVSGGTTGQNGVASLSVGSSDLNGDICMFVEASRSLASQYGRYQDCTNPLAGSGSGTAESPRLVSVSMQSANVRTTVLSTDGTANRWGGVRVEGSGSETLYASLNDEGRLALYLADGDYTVWFYPGPYGKGAPVSVSVTVTGGVASLPASVTLDSGNVTGTVTQGGDALASGFVSAVNSATNEEKGIGVAPDGTFNLSLGNGSWSVKAFDPVTNDESSAVTVVVSGGGASPNSLTLAVN